MVASDIEIFLTKKKEQEHDREQYKALPKNEKQKLVE